MALPEIFAEIGAASRVAALLRFLLVGLLPKRGDRDCGEPSLVLCLATARPSLSWVRNSLDQGRSHVFYNIYSLLCILIFTLSTLDDAGR